MTKHAPGVAGAISNWFYPLCCLIAMGSTALAQDAHRKPIIDLGSSKPIGSADMSIADYPPEALRLKQEGVVTVSLDVDADGIPGNCSVVEHTWFEALDGGTCAAVIKRIRYEPVRLNGSPVAVTRQQIIRWSLGKR